MASSTPAANESQPEIKLPVLEREQLILNHRSYNWITERICGVLENRQPLLWWLLFIPSALIAMIGVGSFAAMTGVMGGMLAATFLAIFFVPMFYKVITAKKDRCTPTANTFIGLIRINPIAATASVLSG